MLRKANEVEITLKANIKNHHESRKQLDPPAPLYTSRKSFKIWRASDINAPVIHLCSTVLVELGGNYVVRRHGLTGDANKFFLLRSNFAAGGLPVNNDR